MFGISLFLGLRCIYGVVGESIQLIFQFIMTCIRISPIYLGFSSTLVRLTVCSDRSGLNISFAIPRCFPVSLHSKVFTVT